eukprot:2522146-Pleurochrysis_carterae.AAC.4
MSYLGGAVPVQERTRPTRTSRHGPSSSKSHASHIISNTHCHSLKTRALTGVSRFSPEACMSIKYGSFSPKKARADRSLLLLIVAPNSQSSKSEYVAGLWRGTAPRPQQAFEGTGADPKRNVSKITGHPQM